MKKYILLVLLPICLLLSGSNSSAKYKEEYQQINDMIATSIRQNNFAATAEYLGQAHLIFDSSAKYKTELDSLSILASEAYAKNIKQSSALLETYQTCLAANDFTKATAALAEAEGLGVNLPEVLTARKNLSAQKVLFDESSAYAESAKAKLSAKDFAGSENDLERALRIYPNIEKNYAYIKTAIQQAKDAPSSETENSPAEDVEQAGEGLDPNSAMPVIAKEDAPYLLLVNKENTLPSDYIPNYLREISGCAYKLQEKAAQGIEQLLRAMKTKGIKGMQVTSAYRPFLSQKKLFANKVAKLLPSYPNKEAATTAAATVVAFPGTSEHQTGLAVDAANSYGLEQAFGKTKAGKWIAANSWRYGFVVRYPENKQALTNIVYEPWHLRYVGKTAAKYMTEHKLCLEEFIALYNAQNLGSTLGSLSKES